MSLSGAVSPRLGRVVPILLVLATLGGAAVVGLRASALLLVLIGPVHPPTANDAVSLGRGRIILGWASLPFVLIGFTPVPFYFQM